MKINVRTSLLVKKSGFEEPNNNRKQGKCITNFRVQRRHNEVRPNKGKAETTNRMQAGNKDIQTKKNRNIEAKNVFAQMQENYLARNLEEKKFPSVYCSSQ